MATQENLKKFTIVDLKKIYEQNKIPYKKTGVKKQDYIKKLVQQEKKGVVVRLPKQLDQRLKDKKKAPRAPPVPVPAPVVEPVVGAAKVGQDISQRLTDNHCKKSLKEDLQKALRHVNRPFTSKDKKDVLCEKLKDYFREKGKAPPVVVPPAPPVKPKSATPKPEQIPYKSCKQITVKELVPLLKKVGITNFTSKTKKADLCKLLESQIQRRKTLGIVPPPPRPPTPPRPSSHKPPTPPPRPPTPPRPSSHKPSQQLPTEFGEIPPTQEETVQQIIEKVKKCIRESTV